MLLLPQTTNFIIIIIITAFILSSYGHMPWSLDEPAGLSHIHVLCPIACISFSFPFFSLVFFLLLLSFFECSAFPIKLGLDRLTVWIWVPTVPHSVGFLPLLPWPRVECRSDPWGRSGKGLLERRCGKWCLAAGKGLYRTFLQDSKIYVLSTFAITKAV